MAWSLCAASISQSSCTYNIEHVFKVVKYLSGMALNTHSLLRAHGLRAMRSIELAIVRAWLRDHALYRVRYHQMYTIASTHSTSFERKRLSLRQYQIQSIQKILISVDRECHSKCYMAESKYCDDLHPCTANIQFIAYSDHGQ